MPVIGAAFLLAVGGALARIHVEHDADRLCRDPAMRWVVGDRAINGSAASASQMGRFETKWLCRQENLAALADLPGQWIDKVHQRRPPKMIVHILVAGQPPEHRLAQQTRQPMPTVLASTRVGQRIGARVGHPLFVFNQFGDVEHCVLRPGNVRSADGWRAVLEPVIARYRGSVKRLYFRGDAAFGNPEMYEYLEAESIGYAIRLPATGSCRTGSGTCSSALLGDRRMR
jgi:DDE family transposase